MSVKTQLLLTSCKHVNSWMLQYVTEKQTTMNAVPHVAQSIFINTRTAWDYTVNNVLLHTDTQVSLCKDTQVLPQRFQGYIVKLFVTGFAMQLCSG